jgi:predicted nucleic acid-binding protein
MIILDTDVISAAVRPAADESILAWLDRQELAEMHVTSISFFEMLTGVEAMPKGRKRDAVEAALERTVRELFAGRILPFDEAAARVAAQLYGLRRGSGIVVGTPDTQIAGIAVSRGASIATRNVRHFLGLSVPVINPWEAA